MTEDSVYKIKTEERQEKIPMADLIQWHFTRWLFVWFALVGFAIHALGLGFMVIIAIRAMQQ